MEQIKKTWWLWNNFTTIFNFMVSIEVFRKISRVSREMKSSLGFGGFLKQCANFTPTFWNKQLLTEHLLYNS